MHANAARLAARLHRVTCTEGECSQSKQVARVLLCASIFPKKAVKCGTRHGVNVYVECEFCVFI